MNSGSLRLATRLSLAFGVVVLLAMLSNVYALVKLNDVEVNPEHNVTDTNVKTALANQMADSVHVVSRIVRTVLPVTTEQQRLALQEKLAGEDFGSDLSSRIGKETV